MVTLSCYRLHSVSKVHIEVMTDDKGGKKEHFYIQNGFHL